MDTKMSTDTNLYQRAFKTLLERKRLDALIIYANAYDDRYMKVLSGTYAVLQNYLMITKDSLSISVSRYLLSDLRIRTREELLPAESEEEVIEPIKEKLGTNKRIGIIGACKFLDIRKLKPVSVTDLTAEAEILIRFKSDRYIIAMKKYANSLATIMDRCKIHEGKYQLEISTSLQTQAIAWEGSLAFPICITSGRDLYRSTAMLARKKRILSQDIICIDMGLKKGIYTTDRTRMYFVNMPKAKHLYEEIRKHHNEIISTVVTPGVYSHSLVNEYRRRLAAYDEIRSVRSDDLGHGIGFTLHEKPFLEQKTERLERNMIFTIEPTFVTSFGLMRIEDMVGILSTGKVINLTKH